MGGGCKVWKSRGIIERDGFRLVEFSPQQGGYRAWNVRCGVCAACDERLAGERARAIVRKGRFDDGNGDVQKMIMAPRATGLLHMGHTLSVRTSHSTDASAAQDTPPCLPVARAPHTSPPAPREHTPLVGTLPYRNAGRAEQLKPGGRQPS